MKSKLLLSALVLLLIVQISWAQIPQTMSYQGFLTDASSTPVADGNYSLAFSIYNVETGGAALWLETHASVAVNEGIFNVILGSGTPLNIAFDAQYWLEVEVNSAVVSPRVPLTSSPYSLNAQTIADGAVTGAKIADGQVVRNINDLKDGVILAEGTNVTIEKSGNTLTISATIADGSVTSGKIASNAVTTLHILNGTITAEDVGFNYAGSTSPAGPATDLVSNGAVDTNDIADDAVTGDKVADGHVVRSINSKTDDVILSEGANVTITPSGNTLIISSSFDGWSLTGNAGTNPTANFLGTTDDQALEFRVNNKCALRLEPHSISPNLIGGQSGNWVVDGVYGATISGGGRRIGISVYPNSVTGNFGTVGGGYNNTASDQNATVGGGYNNTASGIYATVSGGVSNTASGYKATAGGGVSNTASGEDATVSGGLSNIASNKNATVSGGARNEATGHIATVGGGYVNTATCDMATVGGGSSNTASGDYATVGGGCVNTASGDYATVPGGYDNKALGSYSFAAGRKAKADEHGSFIFADSTNTGPAIFNAAWPGNDFSVLCTGGARFVTVWNSQTGAVTGGMRLYSGGSAWASMSDRNVKDNFTKVDGRDILKNLVSIPIETWNYKAQDPSIRHIGPMAQDFYAAFGMGEDDKYISTIDADGVALAAIQGLYELAQEKDARIAAQEKRIVDLEARLAALEASMLSRDR